VKTLDRVRNVVDRFEMFTHCLVNRKSRDLELWNKVSILRYTSKQEPPYPASSSQGGLPRTLYQYYFCPLHRHPLVVKWRWWIGNDDLAITVNSDTVAYNRNDIPRLRHLMHLPTCPPPFFAERTGPERTGLERTGLEG
jgi:hypothetical protein